MFHGYEHSKVKMKVTICVFLAFACLALAYAYPAAEEEFVKDDVAAVHDKDGTDNGGDHHLSRVKRHYRYGLF